MAHYLIGIIPAFICIAYGICIMLTASGTGFFLVWFILAGVIILQTFLPVISSRASSVYSTAVLSDWFLHTLKILLKIFWIIFASVVGVTWILIGTHFADRGEPDFDYIIVLGSQVRSDGPALITQYRLDAAKEYLDENPDTICIVTGGQGWNEPAPEAVVMKEYLVRQGIDSERILVEDKSQNTLENIRNAKAIIKDITNKVGIVTNNFHVFRGVMLARYAGFENVSGIAAYTRPFYLPNNMLRETCGIVKDFLYGHFF